MRKHMISALAALATLTIGLSACAGTGSSATSNGAATASNEKTLNVTASFYPIAWLTEQVGGNRVTVASATPNNVEPHDFELAPKAIASIDATSALFYVAGFQPSVDEAAGSLAKAKPVDLSGSVDLVKHASAGGAHTDTTLDPHFWLDPQRMTSAAKTIAATLEKMDPEGTKTYQANLAAVTTKLEALSAKFSAGLNQCERKDVVTSHAAFGYLTDRYGLTQVSISGIDPDSDPSPADLKRVAAAMKETGATTVFTEELLSPKTAEALASQAGAQTDVLATLEAKPEHGDYLDAMESNLTALRKALACK